MKFIYLIKAEIDNIEHYKIGITSRDPEYRLKELQTGNSSPLEIIQKFKTNYGNLMESTLHRTYCLDKQMGEWFSLNKEQVDNFLTVCENIENNFKNISSDNTFLDKNRWKKF